MGWGVVGLELSDGIQPSLRDLYSFSFCPGVKTPGYFQ
jgi:hypothetical protein